MSFNGFGSLNTNPASSFGGNKFGGSTAFGTTNNSFAGLSRSPGMASMNNSFSGQPVQNSPQTSNSAFGSFGNNQNSSFNNNSNATFGTHTTSTPAFGAPNAPSFGAPTQGFGNNVPNTGFGAVGGSSFGRNLNQGFGSTATPAFGSTGNTSFGASGVSGFGTTAGTSGFGNPTGSSGFINTSGGGFGSQGFNNTGFNSGSNALSSFGSNSQKFGGRGGSPFQNTSSPLSARPTIGATGFGTPGNIVTSGLGSDIGSSKYNGTPFQVKETIQGRAVSHSLHHICSADPYKGKSQEEIHLEDLLGKSAVGSQPSQFGMPTSNFSTSQPMGQAPAFSFNLNQQPQQGAASGFGAIPQANANTSVQSLGFDSNASQPSPFGISTASGQSPFGAQTALQPAPGFLGAANSQQPFGLSAPSPFGGAASSSSTFTNPSMTTQNTMFSKSPQTFSSLGTPQQGQGFMNLPSTAPQPSTSTFTSPFNLTGSSFQQPAQPQTTLSNFSFPQNSQQPSNNVSSGLGLPSFNFSSSQNTNGSIGQLNFPQATIQPTTLGQFSSSLQSTIPSFNSNLSQPNYEIKNVISSLSQKIMFIKNKTVNLQKDSLENKKEAEPPNMVILFVSKFG